MRKFFIITIFAISSICAYAQYSGGVTAHFTPKSFPDLPLDPYSSQQYGNQYEQPYEEVVEAYYIVTDYNNNKKLRPVRIKVAYSTSTYQVGSTPNCYISSVFDKNSRRWINCGTTSISRINPYSDLGSYLSEYFDYTASISGYGLIFFNL